MKASFRQRGGNWVIAQNVLTVAAVVLGPLTRGHRENSTLLIAGWAAIGIGGLFGITGFRSLGSNLSIFPKPPDGSELVQHGAYRWVRHPLYASLIFLALGWGLVWASWPTLVVGGLLAVVLDGKARVEERWLEQRFPAYRDYATRVRRLIPWIY